MHRRQFVTSLAIGSVGIAASSIAAKAAMPVKGMESGDAEMKHAADTMTVGSLSLATSRIALEKASGPMVKQFAEFETAEQETIADILMSMKKDPSEAQGALMKPTKADVDAMLDAKGKDMVSMLQTAAAGKAFDTDYVKGQLDGHKKLLAIQEDYLKVGNNREHLDVAKLARGQIKEHIRFLEDIQSKMS